MLVSNRWHQKHRNNLLSDRAALRIDGARVAKRRSNRTTRAFACLRVARRALASSSALVTVRIPYLVCALLGASA